MDARHHAETIRASHHPSHASHPLNRLARTGAGSAARGERSGRPIRAKRCDLPVPARGPLLCGTAGRPRPVHRTLPATRRPRRHGRCRGLPLAPTPAELPRSRGVSGRSPYSLQPDSGTSCDHPSCSVSPRLPSPRARRREPRRPPCRRPSPPPPRSRRRHRQARGRAQLAAPRLPARQRARHQRRGRPPAAARGPAAEAARARRGDRRRCGHRARGPAREPVDESERSAGQRPRRRQQRLRRRRARLELPRRTDRRRAVRHVRDHAPGCALPDGQPGLRAARPARPLPAAQRRLRPPAQRGGADAAQRARRRSRALGRRRHAPEGARHRLGDRRARAAPCSRRTATPARPSSSSSNWTSRASRPR